MRRLLLLALLLLPVPALAQTSTAPAVQPDRITEYKLPPDVYAKAHRLSRIRFASEVVGLVWGISILWLVLKRRWSARFRDLAERATRNRFSQAWIFTPLFLITLGLLQFPLDLFNHWISKLYGISVQTWPSWFGDVAKTELLSMIFGSLLIGILYVVIRRFPRRWWLVFWGVAVAFTITGIFIAPYVIDPLFNKFEPLQTKAPALIPELERVTSRGGMEIPPSRMFWMEASNKTIVPNAYVTGFGASKRVVIWDTTLAQETTEGTLATFGHEMGHYVLGHIWKGILLSVITLFILFYLGYRTIGGLLARYGAAWHVRDVGDLASLPALLLLFSMFGFFFGIAGSNVSRYQEHMADIYGLEVTTGIIPDPGQAAAISFQKYGQRAFVDPDPNPVQVFLFYDHPTVKDRVHLFATYNPQSHPDLPELVK